MYVLSRQIVKERNGRPVRPLIHHGRMVSEMDYPQRARTSVGNNKLFGFISPLLISFITDHLKKYLCIKTT
jgi:hypothetical protein